MRLLSGEKIEDIINSMPSYPHAQTQDNINPSERVLEGDYWFLNLKDEMKKERGFFDQVIDNILRRSEESEKNQQQPQEEDEFFAVNSVNRNLLQKGRDIC